MFGLVEGRHRVLSLLADAFPVRYSSMYVLHLPFFNFRSIRIESSMQIDIVLSPCYHPLGYQDQR